MKKKWKNSLLPARIWAHHVTKRENDDDYDLERNKDDHDHVCTVYVC